MYGTNDKSYEPANAFNKVYMEANMNEELRRGFVRKVYGILGIQLSITSVVVALFWWHAESMGILPGRQPQPWVWAVMGVSLLMVISVNYIMCCCSGLLRQYPTNYIILGIFTAGMSVFLGFIAAQHWGASVLMAVGLTAVIVTALLMFAVQTKYDITGWGIYLFAAGIALFLISMVMIFVPASDIPVMNKIYSALVVLLLSFHIVYDMQLIAGGRLHELTIDDYVLGALLLYVDIVTMFIHLLQLFGERR